MSDAKTAAYWTRYIHDIWESLPHGYIHPAGLRTIWEQLHLLRDAAVGGDHDEARHWDRTVREKIEIELDQVDEDFAAVARFRTAQMQGRL